MTWLKRTYLCVFWRKINKLPSFLKSVHKNEHLTQPTEKKKKKKHGQIQDHHVLYGFICAATDPPQPMCFLAVKYYRTTPQGPFHLSKVHDQGVLEPVW